MMKFLVASIAVFGVLLLGVQDARAQQFTLTVTPSPFVFQSADPPAESQSDVLTVGYKAAGMGSKKDPNNAWHLSIRAERDLELTADITTFIPITSVRWTATAPFAASGSLSKTTDQTLYSGVGNMTAINYATITFYLANSWTYKAGTYTTTIVFTMSQP